MDAELEKINRGVIALRDWNTKEKPRLGKFFRYSSVSVFAPFLLLVFLLILC